MNKHLTSSQSNSIIFANLKKDTSKKFLNLCDRFLAHEFIEGAMEPLHGDTGLHTNSTIVLWFGNTDTYLGLLFKIITATASSNFRTRNDLLCLGFTANIMPNMIQYMQVLGCPGRYRRKSEPVGFFNYNDDSVLGQFPCGINLH